MWGPGAAASVETLKAEVAELLKEYLLSGEEDEAVVAELLRRCGGALTVVDPAERLEGVAWRPGRPWWKVVDDEGHEHPAFDAARHRRSKFTRSMWPPSPGDGLS